MYDEAKLCPDGPAMARDVTEHVDVDRDARHTVTNPGSTSVLGPEESDGGEGLALAGNSHTVSQLGSDTAGRKSSDKGIANPPGPEDSASCDNISSQAEPSQTTAGQSTVQKVRDTHTKLSLDNATDISAGRNTLSVDRYDEPCIDRTSIVEGNTPSANVLEAIPNEAVYGDREQGRGTGRGSTDVAGASSESLDLASSLSCHHSDDSGRHSLGELSASAAMDQSEAAMDQSEAGMDQSEAAMDQPEVADEASDSSSSSSSSDGESDSGSDSDSSSSGSGSDSGMGSDTDDTKGSEERPTMPQSQSKEAGSSGSEATTREPTANSSIKTGPDAMAVEAKSCDSEESVASTESWKAGVTSTSTPCIESDNGAKKRKLLVQDSPLPFTLENQSPNVSAVTTRRSSLEKSSMRTETDRDVPKLVMKISKTPSTEGGVAKFSVQSNSAVESLLKPSSSASSKVADEAIPVAVPKVRDANGCNSQELPSKADKLKSTEETSSAESFLSSKKSVRTSLHNMPPVCLRNSKTANLSPKKKSLQSPSIPVLIAPSGKMNTPPTASTPILNTPPAGPSQASLMSVSLEGIHPAINKTSQPKQILDKGHSSDNSKPSAKTHGDKKTADDNSKTPVRNVAPGLKRDVQVLLGEKAARQYPRETLPKLGTTVVLPGVDTSDPDKDPLASPSPVPLGTYSAPSSSRGRDFILEPLPPTTITVTDPAPASRYPSTLALGLHKKTKRSNSQTRDSERPKKIANQRDAFELAGAGKKTVNGRMTPKVASNTKGSKPESTGRPARSERVPCKLPCAQWKVPVPTPPPSRERPALLPPPLLGVSSAHSGPLFASPLPSPPASATTPHVLLPGTPGQDSPPMKRLKLMCNGADSSLLHGVPGLPAHGMYPFYPHPQASPGIFVPQHNNPYLGHHLPLFGQHLPAPTMYSPLSPTSLSPSSPPANGYDAPLELTTKRSQDRSDARKLH